jgi:hypothetical protein
MPNVHALPACLFIPQYWKLIVIGKLELFLEHWQLVH